MQDGKVMKSLSLGLLLLLLLSDAACGQLTETDRFLAPLPARFRILDPGVVMAGVPVREIEIEALDQQGQIDTNFNGRAMIEGIIVEEAGEAVAIPPFQSGRILLKTDLALQRRVFVDRSVITVQAMKGPDPQAELEVVRIPGFLSLLPPLLAIGMAVWLRNVICALFAGVWVGALILARGNFFVAFLRCLDKYILEQLTQPDSPDNAHLLIVLFTLFLGAMIGVMSRSGGTHGLVDSMARFTKNRQRGQLTTWFLGMVVFFDDYANSLLVGGTMRPMTDRLKISREKLAFLVDSTAAPIAGLALISTWVGFELGQIQDTYEALGLESEGIYEIFLYSIPFRFYAVFLIVFVGLIALLGHDYGPMLRAEIRSLVYDQPSAPDASIPEPDDPTSEPPEVLRARNAIIPICGLVILVMVGMWSSGSWVLDRQDETAVAENRPVPERTLRMIVASAESNRVLLFASFAASLIAIASAIISKSLTLQQSIEAWLNGAKSMFLAVVILVMAWALADICDDRNLNTAGFLVEHSQQSLAVQWVPALVFVLAALVSFATGSSFTTMGLLMPLAITVTYSKLATLDQAAPDHHLMIASIGSVLAGAIFGDHCSPISDTTVLSSAATNCDHLDHVTTQLPYAATVAGVSLLFGYVPIGLGYSFLPALLPMGAVVLYMVIQFYGRSAETEAERLIAELGEAQAESADGEEDSDEDDAPSKQQPDASAEEAGPDQEQPAETEEQPEKDTPKF